MNYSEFESDKFKGFEKELDEMLKEHAVEERKKEEEVV
jgi:V/A-type H+-transporting ATPase subunit A